MATIRICHSATTNGEPKFESSISIPQRLSTLHDPSKNAPFLTMIYLISRCLVSTLHTGSGIFSCLSRTPCRLQAALPRSRDQKCGFMCPTILHNTFSSLTLASKSPRFEQDLLLSRCSLSADEANLGRLRQQMSILWGNLEELKGAVTSHSPGIDQSDPWESKLSNVPFECCIEEYGQELDPEDIAGATPDEFVRIFQMTKTTIT